MLRTCPQCKSKSTNVHGRYRRLSDGARVARFRCLDCKRTFSEASRDVCFAQKKRHVNHPLWMLLVSGVSLRRVSKILRISRTTSARKLLFLGQVAKRELRESLQHRPRLECVEFDDMETFESSKCKPLSISLAVESGTRRILGFEVSQMPANGPLAKKARRRYGPRRDQRLRGRKRLLRLVRKLSKRNVVIKSDENPHYPPLIRELFPRGEHLRYKGRRGCVVGQGELKRGGFDPLFSLNHTAAMFRANVNRLFRRTWCTTKKREALTAHLALYSVYHNQNLR
jgi:transposase-like protein